MHTPGESFPHGATRAAISFDLFICLVASSSYYILQIAQPVNIRR